MNIPIFSKLFSKKKKQLIPYESVIVKTIDTLAQEKGYLLFKETPVFHRSNSITPPLVLFVPNKGLLIFEYKDWTYKELQNATVSKGDLSQNNASGVAFSSTNEFFKEKYFDITNKEDIAIFNFVILEQLTQEEFSLLDESFQELLPTTKLFFADEQQETIEQKIQALPDNPSNTIENILPYIYNQFAIYEEQLHFANIEQREFITHHLPEGISNLNAQRRSGKSSIILLKALYEKLQNNTSTIAIITPDDTTANELRQKLLALIEFSTITIEVGDISIKTPQEVIEFYAQKLQLPLSEEAVFNAKKHFALAQIVFVDDTLFIDEAFCSFLEKIQHKNTLLFANHPYKEPFFTLQQHYHGEAIFLEKKDAYYLKLLYHLLEESKTDIALFMEEQSIPLAQEDICSFCGVTELQEKGITLYSYTNYTVPYPQYAILLETRSIPLHHKEYFFEIATQENYIIKETENG